MTLLLCAASLSMVQLEQLGIWLMLAETGPLCPHAHSKMIFVSPILLVRVFMDAFIVFPKRTAWLRCPTLNIWGCWLQLGILGDLHMHIITNQLIHAQGTHAIHTS